MCVDFMSKGIRIASHTKDVLSMSFTFAVAQFSMVVKLEVKDRPKI